MNVHPVAWIIVHAIGFICLVLLLKKSAWGAILAFIDERREAIARQYREVDQLKADAEKMHQEYKSQIHQAQAEARELVTKARTDAAKLADQLKAETQAAVEKSRKEASARIAQETETAKLELRRHAANLAVAVAEKFLAEGLTPEQRRRISEETLPEIERAAAKN